MRASGASVGVVGDRSEQREGTGERSERRGGVINRQKLKRNFVRPSFSKDTAKM